jgi:hypothetical protein
MFNFMGVSTLAMVYLVLFTSAIPTKDDKQKYITAAFGLLLSLCLFFVFPTLLLEQG